MRSVYTHVGNERPVERRQIKYQCGPNCQYTAQCGQITQ
uniref:Uncharacterized protein n=1 Tax=Rhizophora mucronata TaxID=61149 RepID=A0A2P2QHV2_RHIMU